MAEPDATIIILRPDDLLVLTIEGTNLAVDDGGPGRALRRIVAAEDAFLGVLFPPQSFGERAFHDNDAETEATEDPPVNARASAPTRLVFRLPLELDSIPLTMEGLLDWRGFESVLVPAAGGPTAALPVPPLLEPAGPTNVANLPHTGPPQTSLALPYRMVLSPDATAAWSNAVTPVTGAGGRVELWHARLGTRTDTGENPTVPPLRVVWSPDFVPAPGTPPALDTNDALGRSSLKPSWRHQLVRLTSSGELFLKRRVVFDRIVRVPPVPIQASQLHLSALGGTLKSAFNWLIDPASVPGLSSDRLTELPDGINVSAWRHIMTGGRDQYVRVVEEGVYTPIGHRAARITITERKFQPDSKGHLQAYLRQYEFIVSREKTRTYDPAAYRDGGKENPLSRITLNTVMTPALDGGHTIGEGQLIYVGGLPFQFSFTVTDVAGHTFNCTGPLAFVSKKVTTDASTAVDAAYTASEHTWQVAGDRVSFARPDPEVAGETALMATGLRFKAIGPGGAPARWNAMLPELQDADVRLEPVEQLTGRTTTSRIRIYAGYRTHGMGGANAARIFAEILTPAGVAFSADQAGGVATPNMALSAVSQHLGVMGGTNDPAHLAEMAAGAFTPSKVLDGLTAKLFGIVPLKDLIQSTGPSPSPDPDQYPKMLTRSLPDGGSLTTLDWKPTAQPVTLPGATVTPDPQGMSIHTELRRHADGSEAESTVHGTVERVKVEIAGILELYLDSFEFTSAQGQPPAVTAQLGEPPFVFIGALTFVEEIKKLIPPGIFGGGPRIDITPAGLDIGYELALPPASVGIFAMQDIALNAGLHLPFTDGELGFRFAISSRERPFLITVALFGGGGFFALETGLSGVRLVEASFEFGGAFALNLGVASGSVSVMAGIYLRLDTTDGTTLEGYVRVNGEVDVLGLISITVEFLLSLRYHDGKAVGQATLTVGIHIAFFSTSVSLTVERSFGGSSGDPTVQDMLEASAWAAYAAAFA